MKGQSTWLLRRHWLPAAVHPPARVPSIQTSRACAHMPPRTCLPVHRLPLQSTARPGRWQVYERPVVGAGEEDSILGGPFPTPPSFLAWCSACLLSLRHQRFIKAETQQSVCLTSLNVFLPNEKFSGKGRKLKGVQKGSREGRGAAERKLGGKRGCRKEVGEGDAEKKWGGKR